MKTLITVREVTEVEEDSKLGGPHVMDQYLDYDPDEWDEYAVEEAVQIAEGSGDDTEVVAVTIGPKRSEETIRTVLAKGVDRAVRVRDDTLDGVDLLDVAAKTRPLSAVVRDENPDLVLTGVQANDDSFGTIGVSLVSAIGFKWAAVVNALDLDADDDVVNVRRELEGGAEEPTKVDLPTVLTIQIGINGPCYASLRGIRQAQSKGIRPLALSGLSLDAATIESDLVLTDVYELETESDATYFEGDAGKQAADLATVLREKGVDAQ